MDDPAHQLTLPADLVLALNLSPDDTTLLHALAQPGYRTIENGRMLAWREILLALGAVPPPADSCPAEADLLATAMRSERCRKLIAELDSRGVLIDDYTSTTAGAMLIGSVAGVARARLIVSAGERAQALGILAAGAASAAAEPTWCVWRVARRAGTKPAQRIREYFSRYTGPLEHFVDDLNSCMKALAWLAGDCPPAPSSSQTPEDAA